MSFNSTNKLIGKCDTCKIHSIKITISEYFTLFSLHLISSPLLLNLHFSIEKPIMNPIEINNKVAIKTMTNYLISTTLNTREIMVRAMII